MTNYTPRHPSILNEDILFHLFLVYTFFLSSFTWDIGAPSHINKMVGTGTRMFFIQHLLSKILGGYKNNTNLLVLPKHVCTNVYMYIKMYMYVQIYNPFLKFLHMNMYVLEMFQMNLDSAVSNINIDKNIILNNRKSWRMFIEICICQLQCHLSTLIVVKFWYSIFWYIRYWTLQGTAFLYHL